MNEKQIDMLNEQLHRFYKVKKYSELERKFKRLNDMTTVEISILDAVAHNPDIILKEICELLDIPKSTMTSAIDRLEKRDYLNRVISKRDRRSFGLLLTEEGELAQKEHLALERTTCQSILGALDTYEERQLFLDLIEKILDRL